MFDDQGDINASISDQLLKKGKVEFNKNDRREPGDRKESDLKVWYSLGKCSRTSLGYVKIML